MDRKLLGLVAVAALTIGAGVAGGAAIADAASTKSGTQTPYGGPGGGPGYGLGRAGPEGAPHQHTAVTGSELAKVTAAVKAKESTVTVQHVRKDPDGSYDVFGAKAGKPVMLEVSKDLATITERTGAPGGGMPGGGPGKGGPPPVAPPGA